MPFILKISKYFTQKNKTQPIHTNSHSFFNGLLNYFLGGCIGNIINEGQIRWKPDFNDISPYKLSDIIRKFNEHLRKIPNPLAYENLTIKTEDGCNLSAVEIKNSKNLNCRETIIIFQGRGVPFESNIDYAIKIAQSLDCNTISFNYRGVHKSTGKATKLDNLVLDGVAVVNTLLSRGIRPENIVLYGGCMGGNISTLVAEYFHKKQKKVYVFNDRGFSSFTQSALGIVKSTQKPKGHFMLSNILSVLLYPTFMFATVLSGWEKDITASFLSIPDEYKDYTVIRSSKANREKESRLDDGFIDYDSSLHIGLKKYRKFKKESIKKELAVLENCTTFEQRKKKESLEDELNSFKKHKFDGIPNPEKKTFLDYLNSKNLHNLPHCLELSKIQNRFDENMTGFKYFSDFVNKSKNNGTKATYYEIGS